MGALDEANVETLAGRLGVGERQLRRLFRQHLGASPVSVAQTRRVLLAKQLIHETRLPMAEIAFAAGFGSIRRFNETFRALFGRPPGALRRSSAPDIPAGPRGEVRLLLRYQPPYDWDAMLDFLAARAIPGIEYVSRGEWGRTIEIAGEQGTVTVRPSGNRALGATICFPRLTALPHIIARLRRVFDLSADPLAIASHLAKDPALADLVAARPGLRVPGAWDGFELAIRAVLGQQITVGAARGLAGRLVAAFGAPLAEPVGPLTHVFPAPVTLANADLAALGMPRTRAQTLSAVAAALIEDPDLFSARRSLEDAVSKLSTIKGIGAWTANYIALRQLREPDAFPASDIGLLRALADETGRRPSPDELAARAAAWRPWRAYAAQHLWAAPAKETHPRKALNPPAGAPRRAA
jgi:AraC family transcriptional regulator of adaptative response / DNA-3-methyladenine glycosylase II